MYQFKGLEDTIVAISTPTGQGGIGIVRMSGKEAVRVAGKMFKTKKGSSISKFKSYTVHYGWIVRKNEIIDEVLLTIMRAPKSYTRENVVEISCHGGSVPLRAILTLAIDLGARLAEPGEFTKRAFLNGRIDLPQAEAVLDIIRSKTDAFLKVSHNQLKGELSVELEKIREGLLEIYTEIEAVINFPEEDINTKQRKHLLRGMNASCRQIGKLLKSSEHGKILREGIKVVLCGKPNVGKSSLMNVLLKQPRSIVTDIAGTTRDTIEESAQIKGIPFQFVDTAGVLKPRNSIEKEAVKRSRLYINRADLIIFILDAHTPFSKQDRELVKAIEDKNVIVVINKCDLTLRLDEKEVKKIFSGKKIIKISALKKTGMSALEKVIVENVWHESVVDSHEVLINNVRHIRALKDCSKAVMEGVSLLDDGTSFEFVSEEIKAAINSLDNITGRNVDMDVLDKIFASFCIGK